jgi:DNA-binding NtrC family response regulator
MEKMSDKIRILLLDDEPIVAERVKSSLDRSGFDADAFISSTDAIDQLKKEKYDILITDLKMSSPDGMEVLRIARKMLPGIKAVVITGYATNETAKTAKKLGAVEFIAKPFKMSELKKILKTISKANL